MQVPMPTNNDMRENKKEREKRVLLNKIFFRFQNKNSQIIVTFIAFIKKFSLTDIILLIVVI